MEAHMGNVVCHNAAPLPDDPGDPLPDRRLYICWAVNSRYWTSDFTLMVFHSTSGFCPERHPDDLNKHGRLIIETTSNGSREERLTEGTHFYTFVLHKAAWHGLSERVSVVRFSETVPSAKVGIGRIRDSMELQELQRRHELGPIEHETRVNEAEVRRIRSRQKLEQVSGTATTTGGAPGRIAEVSAGIDAMVATYAARRRKIADLEKDERFATLSPQEKEHVLNAIDERLDPGEFSARDEMQDP
jgi:hypothetical protein